MFVTAPDVGRKIWSVPAVRWKRGEEFERRPLIEGYGVPG